MNDNKTAYNGTGVIYGTPPTKTLKVLIDAVSRDCTNNEAYNSILPLSTVVSGILENVTDVEAYVYYAD